MRRSDVGLVVNALIDYINLERDLEKLKINAVLKEDFNLIDAFGLIDLSGKGYVTASEIREALQDMGMRVSMDEIYLVMTRFCPGNDQNLKYSDFSEAFMPQE